MHKSIAAIALLLTPVSVASAETVQMTPGLWEYEVFTEIEAMGSNQESFTNCVDAESAARTVDEFASRLVQLMQSPQCTVDRNPPLKTEGNNIYFSADCLAQNAGVLNYSVEHSETAFKAEGRGMASMLAAYKSLSGKYLGPCT